MPNTGSTLELSAEILDLMHAPESFEDEHAMLLEGVTAVSTIAPECRDAFHRQDDEVVEQCMDALVTSSETFGEVREALFPKD